MGKECAFATLGLIVVLMVVPMAIAVDHVVGGRDGWTNGVDYDEWIAGKSFNVGDTLRVRPYIVFSYELSHTVDVVGEDGYDNCDARESIVSFEDGNTSVPLTKQGPTYFICAATGHCLGGMKLSVTVQSLALPPETSSPTLAPSPSTGSSPLPADGLVPLRPLTPNTNRGSQKLSNVLGFVFAAMVITFYHINL